MWKNTFVLFYLNIYLVFCAPTEQKKEVSAVNPVDQIPQASKNTGVDKPILLHFNTKYALIQPIIHREDARLEEESIPSKVFSAYDNSQLKVGNFLNPQPIVDTIQEHEKYGNSGDKFYPVGRAIVNGYEGFSNFLNKILDSPTEVAKTISRGLTDTLNVVGGKIVGLVR